MVASATLASYLSKLNPVPGFPEYTGPYTVGTVDVEIPVRELESPSPAPATDIETVQFRIFYPAQPDAQGKRITWLPAPQRHHLSAYIKFLGIGPMVAEAVSFLPRHLHYTTIPAIKNAPILEADTADKRWPTAIFSHGLGGNRNTYSQIVGCLASHGVVVVCPEHRDGSGVVAHVRSTAHNTRVIPYVRIPHDPTDEVCERRCDQLRIRLWELGLVHDAILTIDKGVKKTNLNTTTPSLDFFQNRLQVHKPGGIIFAGHSFGAATMVQLLKSVYYRDAPQIAAMRAPLFTPAPDSAISKQVTPNNVAILLDMWCLPLTWKPHKPLFDLPLPAYADVPSAPGGKAILAIESEAFFKWKEHLHLKARLLSPDPSAPVVRSDAFQRPSGVTVPKPNFFYVEQSAHLNQSDFGLLFPWLTGRVFGSQEPERAIRLNMRAMLQFLRENSLPVSRTWAGDLVEGAHVGAKATGAEDGAEGGEDGADGADSDVHDDKAILHRGEGDGAVRAWHWIDIVGLGQLAPEKGNVTTAGRKLEAEEPRMEAEIEPRIPKDGAVSAVVGRDDRKE